MFDFMIGFARGITIMFPFWFMVYLGVWGKKESHAG